MGNDFGDTLAFVVDRTSSLALTRLLKPGILYNQKPGPKSPETKSEGRIDDEFSSNSNLSEIPFFCAIPRHDANGDSVIEIVMHLDIAGWQLKDQKGIRTQKVIFIAAIVIGRTIS
jgi:hypothetical protein